MSDVDERIREALRGVADDFEPNQPLSVPSVHRRARALRTQTLVWFLVIALASASGAVIGVRATRSAQGGTFVDSSPSHGPDPNFTIARAKSAQLLNLFKLPAGAESLPSAPTEQLAIGPPLRPGYPNFLYTTKWWTVPLSYEGAVAWVQSHPPSGLVLGTQGATGNQLSLLTYVDRHDSRAYKLATLMISFSPIGENLTGIRADGTAVWLTSQPAPDTRTGPRIRVTITSGCPTRLDSYADITNPTSKDLTRDLLPRANPTAALRCLYRDKKVGSTFTYEPELINTRSLDASEAKQLAQTINALQLGSPGSSFAHGCLALVPGTAQTEIIVFRYPGRADVDLWHSKFCIGSVTNGFITTSDNIRDF